MALPAGKTIKEVYGKDVDVSAPIKASPLLEAQAKHLDEGKSLSSMPTKEPSGRSTKGVAAKKLEDEEEKGGRRKSRRRRHSKKTKRTRRRHTRKH